ncbi:MAG: CDP-alcohol phosphatidyltransferase family protein [Pseudomonadota bacterium]|nr:CDP-alcohol phosphatidyltransferase family protein [Pseudomonadota bacterium]
MRRLIDPPLNGVAAIWPRKISANQITIFGLVLGVACFLAIAINTMTAALILLALNRLADGLDGAVARAQTPSELGAYLDIVSDFVLWGLLPIGFIILDSDNAIAAAVLLSSFSMSMTVFLAFAIMAEKRGLETDAQGTKSFFYVAGLAEGTETIAFFAIVIIWPGAFIPAAFVYAGIVYLSVIGRVASSYLILKELPSDT